MHRTTPSKVRKTKPMVVKKTSSKLSTTTTHKHHNKQSQLRPTTTISSTNSHNSSNNNNNISRHIATRSRKLTVGGINNNNNNNHNNNNTTAHDAISTSSFTTIAKKSPLTFSKRSMAMTSDPLGLNRQYVEGDFKPKWTYANPRSATRPLSVLLAGYNSFFAQHLYGKLNNLGFDVVPVSFTDPTHPSAAVHIHSKEFFEENGLSDVDFVVNCGGLNVWSKDHTYQEIYDSRVQSNKFWADLIRKTRAKPYAYLTMSSTDIYPSEFTRSDKVWSDYRSDVDDHSPWMPPWISDYTHTTEQLADFDYQNKITPLQRLWRDAELASRVYIPELDIRTPEQTKEYQLMKQKYDHEHLKMGVFGTESKSHKETLRSSVRWDLLTNDQVRVIPLRFGHIISRELQEFRDYRSELEAGRIGPIHEFDGNNVPWVWADDATDMLIHAMLTNTLKTAINCVTPPATPPGIVSQESTKDTSKDLLSLIPDINQCFSASSMSRTYFDSIFRTPEHAQTFYKHTHVEPTRLRLSRYQYHIRKFEDIYKEPYKGRSEFEHLIQSYNGIENLPRFDYADRR